MSVNNAYRVTVNEKQYISSVNKCNGLVNRVKNKLSNYPHSNLLEITYDNSYYFKILRKDTHNGFQVCVSPINNKIELYIIVNKKKVGLPKKINNYNDINYFLFNNLMIDYDTKIKIKKINNTLTTMFPNFTVQINSYTISMFEHNSQNGYYIYFDFNCYAKIGYILNDRYYDIDSVTINNINDLGTTLSDMIDNNVHKKIKFFNIVNPMYVDCDDSNSNTYEGSDLNTSVDSTEDPV